MVGIVDEVGAGISQWKKGQRAGVGWHGGHDNTCWECRRGDFRNCRNLKVPGISFDGGYQQYMVAPEEAVVAIPETLGDTEAAPLLCAGVTTFDSLRNSGALPGDLVAIRASAVWAISGFNSRTSLVTRWRLLGAGPTPRRLRRSSGPACTSIPNRRTQLRLCRNWAAHRSSWPPPQTQKLCPKLIDGLGPNGKLIVIGVSSDPIEVTPIQLITGREIFKAGAAGTPAGEEDTLNFAELTGVRPMIETYPLEKAGEAYARMMSGKAQFRVVLTM